MLKIFPGLSFGDGSIIFEKECANGCINVFQSADYRWLAMGGDFIQSLISLSEPDDVLLPYTQAMLLAFSFHQKPFRVLNLGAGCGVFERFLYKYYPDISITSVESNIDIIDISREYFYFPSGHPVVNESAEFFLKKNDIKYDIVFCDLHDGEGHPACLTDSGFYENIVHCLNDGSVFVMNLIPGCEKVMMDVLLAVRKHFRWQYLLDFDNYGNIILFMFMQEPRSLKAGDALCAGLMKRLKVDLSRVIDRLVLLPRVNADKDTHY